jgi:MinD superfamily P-loop ATPase
MIRNEWIRSGQRDCNKCKYCDNTGAIEVIALKDGNSYAFACDYCTYGREINYRFRKWSEVNQSGYRVKTFSKTV